MSSRKQAGKVNNISEKHTIRAHVHVYQHVHAYKDLPYPGLSKELRGPRTKEEEEAPCNRSEQNISMV